MKYILSLLIISVLSISAFAQTSSRCGHNYSSYKTMTSDSMDVLHYAINLDIIYLSKKSISGYTDLLITSKFNGLGNIKLDLLKMNIDSIFVDNQLIGSWNYNDTLLKFGLSTSLDVGDTILCSVYYHGQPVRDNSNWGGFYFSNDSTFVFNLGVGMVANPHNYGRVWYPCIDDFIDRATYDFNIVVKNGNVAICNGTLESTITASNTIEYRWKLHDDIPTYLASVAVGNYVAVRDTFNGINGLIPIAIYVPSNKVSQAQASFINLKQILTAYETCYGPYRWERIGYVGVPFSSGAMEHATSIAVGLGYIDGALTYESLFAHELSHHWFGNLVTCKWESDMWLNEGWAVFSESMYKEVLYGKEAYKDNMRDLVYDVLRNTHTRDQGYLPVAYMPHEHTYGSTVYDKGATVAHSIRGYLGDSLFFNMLHDYMSQKAFSAQSSYDFRNFISSNTGIDMADFFDAWVFEPGFINFTIDSFSFGTNSSAPFEAKVWMRQRLSHKPNFALSNRIPITFMDDQWNRFDTIVKFSGEFGMESFNLPFKPATVFCDFEERLAEAKIDFTPIINQTGVIDFPRCDFKLDVKQVNDSVQFHLSHNMVAPDQKGISYPGMLLSTRHFWTVNGVDVNNYDATGMFHYIRNPYADNDIIKSLKDSVVVLYRPFGRMAWQPITFTKNGNSIAGYLEVEHLQNGQYALAAYGYKFLGINQHKLKPSFKFVASPNPSKGAFHFKMNDDFPSYITIYDSVGKELKRVDMKIYKGGAEAEWTPSGQAVGMYFVVLNTIKGDAVYKTSIIISE